MGSGDEKSLVPDIPPEERAGSLLLELSTPVEDGLAILTGNFNDWSIDPGRFLLSSTGPGKFQFRFPEGGLPAFPLEYKYVKGGWDDEEVDTFGSVPPNRRLENFRPHVLDHVPRWKRKGLGYDPEILPVIQVISEQFEIPQLIKTRRIAALLPHDYQTSGKRYPVLYLQDGQTRSTITPLSEIGPWIRNWPSWPKKGWPISSSSPSTTRKTSG